jgi:CO dehydrogenase/acetyl-CoA synthase alpha subunit
MPNMKQIASDLSKLLEETKTKQVIIKESIAAEAPKETKENFDVAIEVVKTVFDNAYMGLDPTEVGEALLFAAEVKAEETKTSPRQIVESVVDYLIKSIESAQLSLDESEE